MKRWIGNILALLVAVGVGIVTMFVSMRYIKVPQIPLDWAVLIFSGLMTGIIAFFVTWGHFQSDPVVGEEREQA